MKFVAVQCDYYCGVDLHSVSMLVCIIKSDGKIMLRKKIPNKFDLFLQLISPFQHNIAIGVESTFNWYWFVDACRDANLAIYLGHVFYMQAIAKDKSKNDKLDAFKIAQLLRAGLFPKAHPCSKEKRPVRDLLRQRNRLKNIRCHLITLTKGVFYQNAIIDLKKQIINNKGTRFSALDNIANEHTLLSAKSNMNLVSQLDKELADIENELIQYTNIHYREESLLLQEIDGVGPIISMTIMYETDDIHRFKHRQDYTSYCRFSKPFHTSDGKIVGIGNVKCGNPYLKYAYMEIISNAVGHCAEIKALHANLSSQYKPLKVRSILASRYCTAVYYMLKRNESFDLKKFCNILPEVMQPVLAAGNKSI